MLNMDPRIRDHVKCEFPPIERNREGKKKHHYRKKSFLFKQQSKSPRKPIVTIDTYLSPVKKPFQVSGKQQHRWKPTVNSSPGRKSLNRYFQLPKVYVTAARGITTSVSNVIDLTADSDESSSSENEIINLCSPSSNVDLSSPKTPGCSSNIQQLTVASDSEVDIEVMELHSEFTPNQSSVDSPVATYCASPTNLFEQVTEVESTEMVSFQKAEINMDPLLELSTLLIRRGLPITKRHLAKTVKIKNPERTEVKAYIESKLIPFKISLALEEAQVFMIKDLSEMPHPKILVLLIEKVILNKASLSQEIVWASSLLESCLRQFPPDTSPEVRRAYASVLQRLADVELPLAQTVRAYKLKILFRLIQCPPSQGIVLLLQWINNIFIMDFQYYVEIASHEEPMIQDVYVAANLLLERIITSLSSQEDATDGLMVCMLEETLVLLQLYATYLHIKKVKGLDTRLFGQLAEDFACLAQRKKLPGSCILQVKPSCLQKEIQVKLRKF